MPLTGSLFRHEGDGGQVTHIELFFDLVYVFAITQLSHHLLAEPTVIGAFQTVLLRAMVWLVWVYTTWVTNWLDPQRILLSSGREARTTPRHRGGCRPVTVGRSTRGGPHRCPDAVRTAIFLGMAQTTRDATSRHRIEVRVSPDQEALIREAAELAHETVTAFMLTTATERASRLVEAQRTVTLSNEVFDRFYASLDEPEAAVPELVELLQAEPLPRGRVAAACGWSG